MALASFQDLCASFCELLKVPTPELKADERGLLAFHVTLRGTVVDLAYRPEGNADHFFAVFEFGPLGEGAELAAQMQWLLDANFNLLQVNPPVFSRNPATGSAVLQYTCPLFETTASGLYELIDREIDRVSRWRERPPPNSTDAQPGVLHQFA